MSSVYTVQTSFSKGEITPLAYGRVDVDFFRSSVERMRNFSVLLHGGARRRSGTKYVAPVANEANESVLFPFSFNNAQSYVLDVNGGGNIQFLANRGYLGAPYTVAHPWAESVLAALSYTQFNDVAYFAERAYAPRKLSRLADTNWSLENAAFEDGPFMPVNQTDTTLTPADTGNAVPQMSNNTTPAPYVASSTAAGADSYQLFDRNEATAPLLTTAPRGFAQIDLGSGNARAVDAYWLQGRDENTSDTPTAWTLDASNDGSNWVVLDRVESENFWYASERRYYKIENTRSFRYYRWTFTGGGGADGDNSYLAQLVLHQLASQQTPFNLTASSTTGINDDAGFLATDVGRMIRLLGSDNRWRWAEIVARTSSTVVTVRLHGHALPDVAPIQSWAMGAFSVETGWPAHVEFFDERLNFGRTDAQPVGVWGTKQGDFEDFGQSDPLLPTDGYSLEFLTSNMNELNWLIADEHLVTGSAKQIRSLGPNDSTLGFSATNLRQIKGPTSGAAAIKPLSIGGTIVYAAAGAKKLRELVVNDQGRYVAPEMSLLGEHTLNAGIVWMVFSENPEPTLYVGTDDGNVAAILYDREQRAVGFAVFEFAGGHAEAGAIIPSQTEGYDDLYLVMRRTINGATHRYIEVLERPFHYESDVVEVDDEPTARDGFFVDCGLTYNGVAATTISNLDHLEGEEVVALADGSVVTGLTVSSGSITLPYAASVVHIGLAYESLLRTHRYSGPGQDGYLFGRRVNQIAVYVDLLSTGALKVGAYDDNWAPEAYEINPHAADAFTGNPVELISGIHRADIDGSWGSGGRIVLKTDAPLPCIIRMIELQAEYEP